MSSGTHLPANSGPVDPEFSLPFQAAGQDLADARTLASSFIESEVLSPLRYPGGKRRLAPLIHHLLSANEYFPDLTVEPFAGGASVGLHLLTHGVTSRLGLADLDELVAAFWQTVFFDSAWLAAEIDKVEVTVAQWDEFRNSAASSTRAKALKCLFLNRTSFSGILFPGAGPIGGRMQQSKYKIDCRFNRAALIGRILKLAKLADRIAFIENCGWEEAFNLVESATENMTSEEPFLYLDPPFFSKADKLYRHSFVATDHEALRNRLGQTALPWLLSYDSPECVRSLYFGRNQRELGVLYSASSSTKVRGAGEALVSNVFELHTEHY